MPTDEERVLLIHECTNCRKILSKADIKMCSGCKVMGYCSKECQKADWKVHKPICTKTTTGTSALTRPPSIKVAERILNDAHIMSAVDGIIVKALDLEHHPEHADKYAVVLTCRVELTDTKRAAAHVTHLLNGREPPPLPRKMPMLFQIGKVALCSGDAIPAGLNTAAEMTRNEWKERELGLLKPGSGEYLIRAMWIAEDSPLQTCYIPRFVNAEMISQVASWRKPDEERECFTDEPMDTEGLIKLFDIRALTDPDMNKKLSIMVPMN